ncbi:MAG: hypothetical protein EXR10_11880 [Alphaproteobacteria bacterium]|nr:hypothetical protein [Alphaproteobacteria bacterium]
MGKFFWIQAMYCLTGILFYVRDLFNHVPMGKGMVNAFIWPYAQWPLIRMTALQSLKPVLAFFQ